MPPKVSADASVARNALMRSFVTSNPLMAPIAAPESSAMGNAHATPQ